VALYMLSTEIAVSLIRGTSRTLDKRVACTPPGELCISAVTRGELLLGVSRQVSQATPFDAPTIESLRKTTHAVLANLTPQEARTFRMQFGIDPSTDDPLEKISSQFEVTRERIRARERAPDLSRVVDQFLARVSGLPWDADAATHFASLAVELHRVGTPLGTTDTMVAGHAMANGAILVVSNENHLPRVAGLRTENWTRRRVSQ